MDPGQRRDPQLWLTSDGSAALGPTNYGSAADDCDHRVADILDPFGEASGLDRIEACLAEVALDEGGMAAIVEGAPDRDRLGPEAAVREADDDGGTGPQRTPDFAQYRDRPLQVLDRDADHRG